MTRLFSRVLLILTPLLLFGCAESTSVKPAGTDTFAITVHGVEDPSDTPESLEQKLRVLFQRKAEAVADTRKYDHYELVSFAVDRSTDRPIARGTIRGIK